VDSLTITTIWGNSQPAGTGHHNLPSLDVFFGGWLNPESASFLQQPLSGAILTLFSTSSQGQHWCNAHSIDHLFVVGYNLGYDVQHPKKSGCHGINYQPQLVSRISEPSTLGALGFGLKSDGVSFTSTIFEFHHPPSSYIFLEEIASS